MKVLVIGADDYTGSILTPVPVQEGFDVTGLNIGYYQNGWLFDVVDRSDRFPPHLNRDLHSFSRSDAEGFDAVAHLAELSSDLLGHNRKPKLSQQTDSVICKKRLIASTIGLIDKIDATTASSQHG